MKQLSKRDEQKRFELVEALRAKLGAIEDAVRVVNDAIAEHLTPAITAYNDLLTEAESWHEDIVREMSDYYDERSEKWQEGDAGQSYNDWRNQWQGLDFSAVDPVDDIADPTATHADELDALPVTPD